MGNESSVLKVFVDEKKKKVMFAEAEEDFVETLFSVLTLPLGTIAKLSRTSPEYRKFISVGSLTYLHESVENLNIRHFSEAANKTSLVNTINSSAHICQKLKVNLDESPVKAGQRGLVFLKKRAKFIITDDLNVLPVVLDTSIALLNSLGVDYIDSLQQRTMYFGVKEFFNLLNGALCMENPLSYLVFGVGRERVSLSTKGIISGNSGQTQTVKLLVQNSKKKVLCAQVENRFVELLFSFLTIPLGACERLTKGISSPFAITNLYNSISSLGDGDYLKSEDVKNILLSPKVSPSYSRATDLLPIYEEDRRLGSFLKEKSTIFMVSDDLKVTTSPSISTISNFNRPGVPIGDMELVELSIGEQEALLLLKASLLSTSALTVWYRVLLRNKPKEELVQDIASTGDGGGGKESKEVDLTSEKKEADLTDSISKEDNHTVESFFMLD